MLVSTSEAAFCLGKINAVKKELHLIGGMGAGQRPLLRDWVARVSDDRSVARSHNDTRLSRSLMVWSRLVHVRLTPQSALTATHLSSAVTFVDVRYISKCRRLEELPDSECQRAPELPANLES